MKAIINYQEYADAEIEKKILHEMVPDVKIIESRTYDSAEFIREAEGVEAALVQYVQVDPRVIDALTTCKGYVRYGIGYNNIDAEYAGKKGKVVANVPHYCIDEVSNHALAMILALNRKLFVSHRLMLERDYYLDKVKPVLRLKDCTVGIVGLGGIGKALAEKMVPLVKRILAYDPWVKEYSKCEMTDLKTVCAESDYISLHLPFLPTTRNLIGPELLASMKPTACLVNTGRGGTVDEEALGRMLKQNRLGGAGLDVYEKEPLPETSMFRELPNVILTSHKAWYSEEAIRELKETAARQLGQILRGERPCYAVTQ
jgi:D-3-phosphoglycerate dehydrogenase / 2-oxoglutarate reductase